MRWPYLEWRILPIFSWSMPMGHITHQLLCLVRTPKIIAMTVEIIQAVTNTNPIAITFPPLLIMRYVKKAVNKENTTQRNQSSANLSGKGLFLLSFDTIISKKAPLGHKFQHQYLPLKNDSGKKKTIIATTRYPSHGLNNPPITMTGRNQAIITCVFFIYYAE